MSYQNIAKAKAIEKDNKERILEVNHYVPERSGIYFLTREDENEIRYAYIGQAKNLLSRLAQHLNGYQHIDLSIKKHGFLSLNNEYGWNINYLEFPISRLDEMEQHFIKVYASRGYQLRNKTAGGQGEGKSQINEYRPVRGYREGILQGKKTLARELSHIIDKHLIVSIKVEKQGNKVSINALEKFKVLLDEDSYKTESEN